MGSRSAAKAWRRSEKRRLRNRARRSTAKTFVRAAELTMASADPQAPAEAVRIAISALDRAAQKGALHPRSVARRKARLIKKRSAAMAAAVAAEETAAAPVRKRRTKKKEVAEKKRPTKKKEAAAEEVAKKKRPSKKKEK